MLRLKGVPDVLKTQAGNLRVFRQFVQFQTAIVALAKPIRVENIRGLPETRPKITEKGFRRFWVIFAFCALVPPQTH